VARAWCS